MNCENIPKDLPLTDPLLFSFLTILDSVNFNINFNGGVEHPLDKPLPCFEYAVNSWDAISNSENNRAAKTVEQTVICAIWKTKPESDKKSWWQYPLGAKLRKGEQWDVTHKFEFEQWRNNTFFELEQIISALFRRATNTDKVGGLSPKFLADIFEWELVGNEISYVYALDNTANKYYGVGATFKIRGNYINCCPKMDNSLVTLQHYQSLGFTFDGCL